MTLFYQAVLRDGGDRLGPRLRRCFAAWAAVDDDGSPRLERSRARTRIVLADNEVCGRYTLDLPTGAGRLRTTATWALGRNSSQNWASFTVEGDLSGDADPVRAPGFVSDLLATGRLTDGAVPVPRGAELVSRDEVDQLRDWLARPDRIVPVIVMTVDRTDPHLVAACADHLAEALAGVAVVVRLFDVKTQEQLNAWLGADLSVFGGGLRTYLPGLRPGEETYPMKHQPRGGGAIRDQGIRALKVVVDGVIEYAVHRPLPADVRQAEPRIARILSGELQPEELHAAPPSPAEIAKARTPKVPRPTAPPTPEVIAEPVEIEPEPDAPEPPQTEQAEMDRIADRVAEQITERLDDGIETLIDKVRGRDSETTGLIKTMSAHLEALTRAVDESGALTRHGNAEELELERLRRQYDQLELDYELLLESERRAQNRVKWLESRLAKHSDFVYGVEDAVGDSDGIWEADSLMDVVQRARKQLGRIDLPDSLDTEVSRLDVTYPRPRRRWAGKAWDALRALDAYAAARADGKFTGGFYDWCSRPLSGGPGITPNMVSMKESDSVSGNPKLHKARVFRVPAEIDPTGRVFMPSHIKLQPIGSPAPRMHFLDDAGGATGRIWIGYIGDHLPNTRTN